jgi:hypothetical protein
MPEPPGNVTDAATPAGTALAPTVRHHPDGVLTGEMIRTFCTRNGDLCQQKRDATSALLKFRSAT